MKNAKRILALIAAILLFGMYLSTLIFALMGSPHSIDLLWASVACTIILPVLYTLIRWYLSLPATMTLTRITTMQAMIPYRIPEASDFLLDRLILFSCVFFRFLLFSFSLQGILPLKLLLLLHWSGLLYSLCIPPS